MTPKILTRRYYARFRQCAHREIEGGISPENPQFGLDNRFSFVTNTLPGTLHMAQLSLGLSNAHTQRELVVQSRVSQVQITARIQPIHDLLVRRIASTMPEAN